jgi:hypothetical protein
VIDPATIAVVRGQIDAYNARDLNKIVTYDSPDGVVRDAAEGRFSARGREEIRSLFDGVFAANSDLHADTPRNLRCRRMGSGSCRRRELPVRRRCASREAMARGLSGRRRSHSRTEYDSASG